MRYVRPRGFLVVTRGVESGVEMDELYHKWTDSPVGWARETVERFNETLREGEEAREVVRVEELPEDDPRIPPLRHEWRKTNLVTILAKGRRGSYDTQRCERCGATGKRWGIAGDVAPDKAKLRGKPCPGDGVEYAPRLRRTR